MKTLILLLSLIPICSFGQTETIESISLDSLIFEKINDYRESKGVDHFVAFEDSLMREFSYGLTRENSTRDRIEHSKDPKFEYYNVECIYSLRIDVYLDKTISEIENGNYERLAEGAVDGWINSPSHERGISRPEYYIATVTSRITIDRKKREIYFVVSYYALANNFNTYSGYSYNY